MLALLSAFFVSLPMSEPIVNYVHVGVFAAVNLVWVVFFHRATAVHVILYFLLNVCCVQWDVLATKMPLLALAKI